MAPDSNRSIRRVTFALLVFSSFAAEIAAVDSRSVWIGLGLASLWIALAAILGRFAPTPKNPEKAPPFRLFAILLALAAAPFAFEALRRQWSSDGSPLEIQMVFALRNLGLGMAAFAGWQLCLRLAVVASLFLMLFSSAMTNHLAVFVLLGLYAPLGGAWLMLYYWSRLKGVLVAPEKAIAFEVLPERQRIPWFGLTLLVFGVAAGIAVAVIGPKRAAMTLGELMPTSGGTGETDPFARYGVGDGPEETAGENAMAAGMVETDKMIEDSKNALIDAVNDMYGPPHKPQKEQERMVAAGLAQVIERNGRTLDNRRPSRDFDTSRSGPKSNRKPESHEARGVLEIEGRTPLHIRLAAFDRYDPDSKWWLEARKPTSLWLEPEGGDWMRVENLRSADWYAPNERHKLKVADLKENLVPTPTLTTRFRIQKVDKPDYYELDYEGVFALAGRKRTPPGVVVTTECRTAAMNRLVPDSFARIAPMGSGNPVYGEIPESLCAQIEAIAIEWAGDVRRGAEQIAAILNRLRTNYRLDSQLSPPENHSSPVLWFLKESKAGPDYLFASSAALLLRSLGYPTRVCLGYYASPEMYDAATGHTPVKASDLHFWPEVYLNDGHWLVVEPTPGYAILEPQPTWIEWMQSIFRAPWIWAGRHPIALSLTVLIALATWFSRRRLLDFFAVQLWLWFPAASWRNRLRGAVRILERRGRWVGRPRASRETVPGWLGHSIPANSELIRLIRLSEWAAYSPVSQPPSPESDVAEVCRSILREWTYENWRTAIRGTPA